MALYAFLEDHQDFCDTYHEESKNIPSGESFWALNGLNVNFMIGDDLLRLRKNAKQ